MKFVASPAQIDGNAHGCVHVKIDDNDFYYEVEDALAWAGMLIGAAIRAERLNTGKRGTWFRVWGRASAYAKKNESDWIIDPGCSERIKAAELQ